MTYKWGELGVREQGRPASRTPGTAGAKGPIKIWLLKHPYKSNLRPYGCRQRSVIYWAIEADDSKRLALKCSGDFNDGGPHAQRRSPRGGYRHRVRSKELIFSRLGELVTVWGTRMPSSVISSRLKLTSRGPAPNPQEEGIDFWIDGTWGLWQFPGTFRRTCLARGNRDMHRARKAAPLPAAAATAPVRFK